MEYRGERLQTILSHRGIASRRHAADIISSGRVTVNGEIIITPGIRVNPSLVAISVDGQPVPSEQESPRTIMLNKPPGCITSVTDSQGLSVMQYVKEISERVVPVGRLDKESEGLLLFSNDGELVQRLTHPSHGHIKTYLVTVTGFITPSIIDELRTPILIENVRTQPADVSLISTTPANAKLQFKLCEGRNRQIRRLCKRSNLKVERLIRTAIGNLELGHLAKGKWRELSQSDIIDLSL